MAGEYVGVGRISLCALRLGLWPPVVFLLLDNHRRISAAGQPRKLDIYPPPLPPLSAQCSMRPSVLDRSSGAWSISEGLEYPEGRG